MCRFKRGESDAMSIAWGTKTGGGGGTVLPSQLVADGQLLHTRSGELGAYGKGPVSDQDLGQGLALNNNTEYTMFLCDAGQERGIRRKQE